MTDLIRRLADWRRSLEEHFSDREEVLDELEDHLRNEVDRLLAAGHAPDRAFAQAVASLGGVELAAEFAKVPPLCKPWLPSKLAWVGGAALALATVRALLPKLKEGGMSSLMAGHMGLVTLGYLSTLLVGFLAACFLLTRLFVEFDPGQARTLRRSVFVLSGLGLLLTGLGIALGCFCPFPKTGWCWGLDTREVGGVVILAWNLALFGTFALSRAIPTAGRMLPGIVGNIIVVLGWFGASLVEKHSSSPAGFAVIAALVICQLAIASTAFVPAGCLRRRA